MILWWVRIFNEFEVNSKETFYPSSSHFSHDFVFYFQVTGENTCYLEDMKEFTHWCLSLERIHAYINIEQEPTSTKEGIPPAYWPASGDLRVENLSSRYSLVCESFVMFPLGSHTWESGWTKSTSRYILPY